MKLTGITRIRNEAAIIQNTLDYVAQFVDEIHVYDDASEDETVNICKEHPMVKKVLVNKHWATTPKGRNAAGRLRNEVYQTAVKAGADYVYLFDADERIEMNEDLDYTAGSYFFRLFDFYITEKDKQDNYLQRKWIGPEYRDIPMIFKVNEGLQFTQRIPRNYAKPLKFGGYVKHYGKAMSVEEWERKCKYYSELRWKDNNPMLSKRWKEREGKAIHTKSDFGRELIQWEDRKNEKLIVRL